MASEHGFRLAAGPARQIAIHLALTLRWSRSISLTSIRAPEEAVRRHVLESLQASAHVSPAAGALLDIGSGNGYPALPIKCLHPDMRAVLLEPALRKSIFLESVIRAAGLRAIVVRRERVDRPEDLERYPGVGNITMRGVNALDSVLEGARALPVSGRVVLATGRRVAEEITRKVGRGLTVRTVETIRDSRDGRLVVLERSA